MSLLLNALSHNKVIGPESALFRLYLVGIMERVCSKQERALLIMKFLETNPSQFSGFSSENFFQFAANH